MNLYEINYMHTYVLIPSTHTEKFCTTHTGTKTYLQRDPSEPTPPSIQSLNLVWFCDSQPIEYNETSATFWAQTAKTLQLPLPVS